MSPCPDASYSASQMRMLENFAFSLPLLPQGRLSDSAIWEGQYQRASPARLGYQVPEGCVADLTRLDVETSVRRTKRKV
jgi:hypothetical protein